VASDDEETLADSFWGVTRKLRHLAGQTLQPWDISPSQSRALGVLVRHGLMRLSELSDHLHIAARSTTEVVDALEQRGLVQRRPDPEDRRATLVAVTEHGTRTNLAIRSARKAEAERLFGSLSDADRAHLARILRQLRD
jgi:DNA-binding MarR family transcriptional regulator